MRNEVNYNVLKITAPGGTAWGKPYVYSIQQSFEEVGIYSQFYGDGESEVSFKKIKQLLWSTKFEANDFLFITAHGKTQDGEHKIELNSVGLQKTSSIFNRLSKLQSPIFVLLSSCYSGACEKDVELLPPGSMVFTTSQAEQFGYSDDGLVIARALAQLKSANISPELGMYFLVHSYLSIHNSFEGNPPSLIIRGYGDVVNKALDDFKLSINANSLNTSYSYTDHLWPNGSHYKHVVISANISEDETTEDETELPVRDSFLISASIGGSGYGKFMFSTVKRNLIEKSAQYWGAPSGDDESKEPFFAELASFLQSEDNSNFHISYNMKASIMSALHNSSLLLLLVGSDSDRIHVINKFGIKSPELLRECLLKSYITIAHHLINNGTDFNDIEIEGGNIMQYALSNYDEKLALVLLANNAPFEHVRIQGAHPVFQALKTDSGELLKAFLERGTSLGIKKGDEKNTMLHLAKHACTAVLLDFGANPNVVNKEGLTPIHMAIKHYDLEKLILLYNYPNSNREIVQPDSGSYKIYAYVKKNYEALRFIKKMSKVKYKRSVGEKRVVDDIDNVRVAGKRVRKLTTQPYGDSTPNAGQEISPGM